MKPLIFLSLILITISCETGEKFSTDVADYEKYLISESPKTTSKYFELWNSKIKNDSLQLLSLGNVAGEYTRYFNQSGDIQFLKKAEKALAKATEIAAVNKAGYQRALSRNYISQHRFKEALVLAKAAREMGSGVRESQSLLFDIHMELGNFDLAGRYLDSIKNMSDFGYLIRVAKWNDHRGELETTIRIMEKAMKKAEFANHRNLKIWSYSNIADYYGHAGRIEDSYNHYLKTLALDHNNAYAKKGIAWIVFSHEKNGQEALRILNTIEKNFKSPDHFLLKAQIARYLGNEMEAAQNLDNYYKLVQNEAYGSMYNIHHINFQIEEVHNYGKALQIASEEVNNRATPETYSLLAYAHFKKGNLQRAKEIIENYLDGKSHEPTVQMRLLEIYNALGKEERMSDLEKTLIDAQYELGPMTGVKIHAFTTP